MISDNRLLTVLQSFQTQSEVEMVSHLITHQVGFTFISKAHPSHFNFILGGIQSHIWSDQHLD